MTCCPAHRRCRVHRPARRFWLVGLAALLAFLALQSGIARDATAQERDVRVGGGCVLIRESGGETLSVGDCGGSDLDPSGDAERESSERESSEREDGGQQTSSPERTSPEEAMPEQTTPEETSPEATEPESTFFGESTRRERTDVGEETSGGDGSCPVEPPERTTTATVARAIDGDTLELEESVGGVSSVRLIGVDSPELEGGDGEPEPGAEEAAAFTAERLEGRRVLLQFDRERVDGYGRLLAYVWVADSDPSEDGGGSENQNAAAGLLDSVHGFLARVSGRQREDADSGVSGLFNLVLIEEEHAEPLAVEPNTLYADCFERAAGEGGTAEEQYESNPPDAPSPETTPPEADKPEKTVSEESAQERTTPEDPPAAEQYEQETLPEELESKDPGKLSAPAPDETLCPDATLLDGVEGGGDASADDAKATLPFTTKGGAVLLAYAAAPADEDVEGGLLGLSLLDEDDALVGESIALKREGAELASIEAPAGEYRVEIGSTNRRYALDIYECAGLEADAPEEPPMQGESPAPPAAEPADEQPGEGSSPPVAEPDIEPTLPEAVPDGGWGIEPEPRDTLAQQDTPEGSAPMLPDTGGWGSSLGSGGVVTLALGCAMLSSGVLLFVSLRQAKRRIRGKGGSIDGRKRLKRGGS